MTILLKEGDQMKQNAKNRFLTWLMFIIPISFCGAIFAVMWTVVQIMLYIGETKESRESHKPLREREDIREINKPENLTEEEKYMIETFKLIKTGDGVYHFDRDKK